MKHIALAPLLAVLIAQVSAAQETAPRPPACTSKEHRRTDFWVGEWTVTENGKPEGRNRISWTVSDDGSVRQLWQHRSSTNEWRTLFDGRYVRTVTD